MNGVVKKKKGVYLVFGLASATGSERLSGEPLSPANADAYLDSRSVSVRVVPPRLSDVAIVETVERQQQRPPLSSLARRLREKQGVRARPGRALASSVQSESAAESRG